MVVIDVTKVADMVSTEIVAKVEANWEHYVEQFDEDALVNDVLQDKIDVELPFYDELATKVQASAEVRSAFSHLKDFIEEQLKDTAEYNRLGPTRYYGMKESDFA